jgi:transposase
VRTCSWLDVEEVGRPAHRLAAYHAIGYLGALSIVAEVGGEWDPFGTARGFMAFTGLVPSEHSSGGRQHRMGITKTGNKVLRTQSIESAWHYRTRPVPGATWPSAAVTSAPPPSPARSPRTAGCAAATGGSVPVG